QKPFLHHKSTSNSDPKGTVFLRFKANVGEWTSSDIRVHDETPTLFSNIFHKSRLENEGSLNL
ncbi:MAG: hypothetical protein RL329_417, partial [Bacteroidota bacterium]